MRKILLLTVILLGMLPGVVLGEDWPSGKGTAADPYRISSVADLQALAKAVNGGRSFRQKYFLLTSDLDLSALRGVVGWVPIGTYGASGFDGIFDGGGHKISRMHINNNLDGQGLFGYVAGGTVKNVIMTDCELSANNFVGVVAGYLQGMVSGCAVRSSRVSVAGTFCCGGGIAGMVNTGSIESCLVSGCTLESNYSNLGGLTGNMMNASISECSVDATTLAGGPHMGGLVGRNEGGTNRLRHNVYSATVKGVKGAIDGADQAGAAKGKPFTVVAESASVTSMPTATSSPTASAATPPTAPAATSPAAAPTIASIVSTASAVKASPVAVGDSETYFVKTNNVKKPEPKPSAAVAASSEKAKEEEPTDFMGKNFRFYSMCDWFEGMRFMVMPEKYDLLVNTFRDAETGREVSSGLLRHSIMVYKGHEMTEANRVHVNFYCENDHKNYYYELPNGTFEDYCYSKMGVPTLAYLGDVDKARELLVGQVVLTRTQFFREDTSYDGDGYREVTVDKNQAVTIKAVGVGSRSFPVKIIVEDENGRQFYQTVAMSKTNSGMRDDEFQVDNEKFLFTGSFDYSGGEMAVSNDVKSYLNKTIHTRVAVEMSSKGSGKVRDVKVPRFTGFIVDEIEPIKNTRYYTLTLRETETRRIYYKEVTFQPEDVVGDAAGSHEDYFGYLFAMGEGQLRNTSLETRTAIREGRVIPGMTAEEVEMAMGEANTKLTTSDGITEWYYPRTNSVLVVQFNEDGLVKQAKARATTASDKKPATRRRASRRQSSVLRGNGTPL